MIRVAALMDTVKVSGPARQLAAIAAPLAAEGVSLHVLAFHPAGERDTPFVRHLRAHGVDCTPVPAYGKLHPRTLRALDAAFDAVQPHIIQTHSYRPNAHVLLSRLRGRRREPWVAFFHGTTAENRLVKLYHLLDRFLLARADAVCVVAESQRRYLSHIRDVAIINNAVLLPDDATPNASSTRWPKAVLYVGRLSHEKGVDVLLDAWLGVVTAHAEATLTIVGDGPERARLEAQCAQLGVTDSVQFVGHQGSPWPWYAQSAVVVLPSRSEGIPNVLLEAIARDLRVVATDAGGIPGVLGEPPAGLMVPAGDTASLRDALIVSLGSQSSPEERDARARVRATFSVQSRGRELAARYRALFRPKA